MIYADYNGSAPLCQDVQEYLSQRIVKGPFANPNAIHFMGQKVLMGMENARAVCAKSLGTLPKHLYFNSGSTEGISHVFYSEVLTHFKEKKILITSGIEHSAVVNSANHYAKYFNLEHRVLPCLSNGTVDFELLKQWLAKDGEQVLLVSIMAANNETGVIQPYKEIAQLCRKHTIPFLCDTTQLIGKDLFNFDESGVDYAVLSGHKIGAMTGTGILMVREPSRMIPMIIGGGQERNLRGGTQHYLGYETLAVALTEFDKKKLRLEELKENRLQFEKALQDKFPKLIILGGEADRLATTSFISYPGVHGQAVQMELESDDIFVTTSSACSDNSPTTSKVLKAMGVKDDVGRGAIRISLGLCSKGDEYSVILKSLTSAFNKLLKIDIHV
ncbi:MAG: cysteine desulfurase [Bdellovibrio sp. CG12_big_fil_rev_8_21_14_0_65_39_13]|nr:MAG: cysteine desulfurase [Bdellovibrio sp. CG22_combo_CG10-13_8_21_14_all_39_27]PIQ58671.1 MAG: cysteine desulfurase [Bdellovibrio sp. CG12_big_fil_rev_8_21_14_0_65_39_13]PIR33046.1 MAG: cysteine desulfurase [Bdellovibrio sp. CG11_big_fil_rev_8_21_14_0_20_39_38]